MKRSSTSWLPRLRRPGAEVVALPAHFPRPEGAGAGAHGVGGYRRFADEFADGTFTVQGAAPTGGLARGRERGLYISGDQAGLIWRVSYVGVNR